MMRWLLFLALAGIIAAQETRFIQVPADHADPEGPSLRLRAIVLKATGDNPKPDPLVYLAGGPGGAATDSMQGLDRAFQALRRERDIVMIDQRGTGGSARYECTLSLGPGQQQPLASPAFPLPLIEACAKGKGTPGALFTTEQSADDIAVAATALGYRELNLYGVSYGTRLGLVFLKRHPDLVRTLALQGVVLPGAPIPVIGTLATARALEILIADCERDSTCASAYPEFRAQLTELLDEPGRGQTLWNTVVAATLYSPETSAKLPHAVKQAAQGDRSALFDLAMGENNGQSEGGGLASGVYLSIICGEDVPQIAGEDLDRLNDTLVGDSTVRGLRRTCRPWPDAHPDMTLPSVDKPVLLIAGEYDPITPPDQAEAAAKALPGANLVLLRATGHSGAANPCAASLVSGFVASGTADTSCAESGRRPPFYVPDNP